MKASGASIDLTKIELPPAVAGSSAEALPPSLIFQTLDDFLPNSVVRQIPALSAILTARINLRAIRAYAVSNIDLTAALDQLCAPDQLALHKAIVDGIRGTPTTDPENASLVDVDKSSTVPAQLAAPQLTIGHAFSRLSQLLDAALTGGTTVNVDKPGASEQVETRKLLQTLVDTVFASIDAQAQPAPHRTAAQWIDNAVRNLDENLSASVDAILHAPSFQSLEATWRSIARLAATMETGPMLKLKVLNARREELFSDLESVVEFDQSRLFKLVYEAEYGTLGGNPFSMLVADFTFTNRIVDIEFLNRMTQIAAAAHAPLLAGADSAMFDLLDYSQLNRPCDLSKIFQGSDHIAYNEFRQTEASQYTALVLPRILLRPPYDYTIESMCFNYIEDVSSHGRRPPTDSNDPEADQRGIRFVDIDSGDKFLWGNAAYVLAQRVINAFAPYNWPAAFLGERGGLVDSLPSFRYLDPRGSTVHYCPVETAITSHLERELGALGFVGLSHIAGTDGAAFKSGQTVHEPTLYLSDEATVNSRLAAQLPYVLVMSRFAHYAAALVRHKTGGFMTRAALEASLNSWLSQYVLLDEDATPEVCATYPLRAAQAVVTEIPDEPGAYKAALFLKPHFQLEELTTSLRVVADLPVSTDGTV